MTEPVGWKDLFQIAGLLMTGVLVPIFLGLVMKRQGVAKDSIEKRMGRVESSIDSLGTAVFARIDTTEGKIVTQFHDLCHERQGACGALQDAKIKGVCNKIESHKSDMENRWKRQEATNVRLASGSQR